MSNMMVIAGVLGIALLLVIFVGLVRQGREARAVATTRERGRDYHAVEIRSTERPCNASRMLLGTRYLSSEAPRIPLPGCDRTVCSCKYVHFKDRRAQQRRDTYLHEAYADGERRLERRKRVGRRTVDRLMLEGGESGARAARKR